MTAVTSSLRTPGTRAIVANGPATVPWHVGLPNPARRPDLPAVGTLGGPARRRPNPAPGPARTRGHGTHVDHLRLWARRRRGTGRAYTRPARRRPELAAGQLRRAGRGRRSHGVRRAEPRVDARPARPGGSVVAAVRAATRDRPRARRRLRVDDRAGPLLASDRLGAGAAWHAVGRRLQGRLALRGPASGLGAPGH